MFEGRCEAGKIWNPKTKRCVKRSGKIGKAILEKNKKILNPETNRLVKVDGLIGKQLLSYGQQKTNSSRDRAKTKKLFTKLCADRMYSDNEKVNMLLERTFKHFEGLNV